MNTFTVASPRRKVATGVLLALTAWALILGLELVGLLSPYTLKTLDILFRGTTLSPASPEIVIINVDQPDLDFFEKQGISWPWPRQVYAPIIEFCQRGQARAVIFDILYTEASVYSKDDDPRLAQAMAAAGLVVLPLFLSREKTGKSPLAKEALAKASLAVTGAPPPGLAKYQGMTLPIPPLLKAAAALGNVECGPDPDGIYRRLPLVGAFQDRFLPFLAFAAFTHFKAPGEWRFETGALVRGDYRVPLDRQGRLLLKFRGPSRSHRRLGAVNVIKSEMRLQHGEPPFYKPEDLAGKWVLVGLTAPGLLDMKPSPMAPIFPGVELHATLLDNLLRGDFLKPAPFWLLWVWALVLALAVTLSVLFAPRLWATLATLVFLLGLQVGLSLLAFRLSWWVDPLGPGAALGLAFALAAAYSYATEGRQKKAIRRMFAQYMSEKVIAHLMAQPERLKLGGERRRVTLFFSDMAGFTSLSERLTPEEVVSLLNEYLSRMTDIILEEEGTVDKFEGDAIMAFWGAPLPQEDQALRACRTALAQQTALWELNRSFKEWHLPPLAMRIGIHTGEAVVGNLGSQNRFDYTVVGDTVNLAARLESLNKFYGTFILTSETTMAECEDLVEFRELDRVAVKGKETPVVVYQPLALKNGLTPEETQVREGFAEGLARYRQGKFVEAATRFEKILIQNPEDGPARMFLRRCQEFQDTPPPPDWDGVFRPDKK